MSENLPKEKRTELMEDCNAYFDKLAEVLANSHEVRSSPYSKDRYLVMKGTGRAISFYGKPCLSFRVSDHWNWRADVKYCRDVHRVQCFTRDLRYPLRRPEKGKASRPIISCCVGYYGLDKKYHIICGEVYNKKTHTEDIIQKDIDAVIQDLHDDLLAIMIDEPELMERSENK